MLGFLAAFPVSDSNFVLRFNNILPLGVQKTFTVLAFFFFLLELSCVSLSYLKVK